MRLKRHTPVKKVSASRLKELAGKKVWSTIRVNRKKHKFANPANGLAIPGALDKRSRRWPNGREELRGKDKEKRRAEIFERAGDRCEELIGEPIVTVQTTEGPVGIYFRCNRPATEWMHQPCIHLKVGNGHGRGFKCDSASCGKAGCTDCHKRAHGQI